MHIPVDLLVYAIQRPAPTAPDGVLKEAIDPFMLKLNGMVFAIAHMMWRRPWD